MHEGRARPCAVLTSQQCSAGVGIPQATESCNLPSEFPRPVADAESLYPRELLISCPAEDGARRAPTNMPVRASCLASSGYLSSLRLAA